MSLRWLLAGLAMAAFGTTAASADEGFERLQVADPYLELHTGPGRGYPVTQVVDRGEWIEVLERRTDWYKVRNNRGREGWVSRAQIERTMTSAGVQKTFRDVVLDDYLSRRLEVGFAGGVVKRDPYMGMWIGYRLSDNLSVEGAYGQVTGNFSNTSLYYVAVVSRPYPEWRLSPFFSLGLGRFINTPRATLVSAIETRSTMANATLGLDYYVTRRFYVRADYRRHIVFVDVDRINEYNEMSLGVGFFF